ncbi:hypothetical protein SASPL_135464 [Salvia splendens]|uniref:AAA ATPase AAA+ lid domain-containing protein n=1 Tax=Salvia splendens TaxID=180675 RepID=A0A8X8ZFT4_SALSN|nr:hypothetical protein SASPL_135464 [Salvia splendens]
MSSTVYHSRKTDFDVERLVAETDGYSGSDLQALCEEAAMMPIPYSPAKSVVIRKTLGCCVQVRKLRYGDFQKAMTVIKPSLQRSKWAELESSVATSSTCIKIFLY